MLEIDAELSLVDHWVEKAFKAEKEAIKARSDQCFIHDEIHELKRLAEKYPKLVTLISEDADEATMSTVRIVRYVNVYGNNDIGALHMTRKMAVANAEGETKRVTKLVEVFDELEQGSDDDKVIADAMQQAEDDLVKPREIFVNIYNSEDGGSVSYQSEKSAKARANPGCPEIAVKFVEAMPDNSIETAINEAVDKMKESSQERKPIHFFMPVDKLSGEIGTPVYGSYKECCRDNGDNYRVGEFAEVMPEPEGDYCWINLYRSTDEDEGQVFGFLNASEQLAKENRSDSLDFIACVKIKGAM